MRIALLTDSFLPHAGGSRVYYFNLFKRIAKTYDDDVTILTTKVAGWQEFDARESQGNLHIRRRFQPSPDLHYSHLPRLLPPLVDGFLYAIQNRIDVLHCGDLWPPGLVGLILKKTLHVPFIAYCHGEEVTLTEHLRIQPKVRDYIYRRADAVIANSDFAIRLLENIGVEQSRIHKISPGIDTNRIFPRCAGLELRQRYGADQNVILLTVGRLIPRKGQDLVIRTLPRLIKKHPLTKYLIVGKGPEESNLRQLAATLDVSDTVEFVGFVPDEQLNTYYNLADVVVMPNRQEENGDLEGFGMVFLEGNAAGKPVVAGKSGGAPEAVVDGQTGFLVNTSDTEELCRALETLISDPELRVRLGTTGLKRACTEFGWEERARKLREISHHVLETRGL